jgi:hypothetical protein
MSIMCYQYHFPPYFVFYYRQLLQRKQLHVPSDFLLDAIFRFCLFTCLSLLYANVIEFTVLFIIVAKSANK